MFALLPFVRGLLCTTLLMLGPIHGTHARVPAQAIHSPEALVAACDTGTATDTGLVLLTLPLVKTATSISKVLDSVGAAHPELHVDQEKLFRHDPYYLDRTPLLAAVVHRVGWTSMQYYRVWNAMTTAVEQYMMAYVQGRRPDTTTVEHKNVNFLFDHAEEFHLSVTQGTSTSGLHP
jgi:hypothetical protein